MPPLSVTKIVGNMKFYSHGIKLPQDFKPGPQYQVSPGEVSVPRLVPPWFTPASPMQIHQDSCDDIGARYKAIHDTMVDAVVFAHELWRLQAKFQGLKIAGPSAVGAAGCLVGPALEDQIKAFPACAGWSELKQRYRDSVAVGVSRCYQKWQSAVTVPGLPWYPAFAMFVGTAAPPTPNIPTPLISCSSANAAMICTSEPMRREMVSALDRLWPGRGKDPYDAIFDAIATVLSLAFTTWLSTQQVMLVLGQGPVPTGHGPVVGGTTVPSPGHLIS
jgi:hypothetical protein